MSWSKAGLLGKMEPSGVLVTLLTPPTVKQFRGSGYHNFFGDRYQQTETYQQTDRPTISLLELLRTAKIKCHATCDMSEVICHMSQMTCDMLHETHPMWHKTCDTWHVTCDTWHVTHDMWHLTCNTWHVPRDTWYVTCDILWGVNIL